ncbi:putative serine carboxypeptidase CPVL [Brevipalpus obovatus]|uniref:putative serine carboxypeptidase CPVL n=1 Tax=Brevipalpus obovatus TaxID=246614 RepID=UPI003D9EC423
MEFQNFLLIFVVTITSIPLSLGRPGSENIQPLFLTSLIRTNGIDQARQAAQVKNLPNAPQLLSYAGYLTVNQTTNANLFFWFFPSENKNAPVTVWLQGGPGSPSTFGLFQENGPFVVHPDMSVSFRNYSWASMYSMLYIDQPVGTGFSFTDSEEGYVNNQEEVARDLYHFLQQFFEMFPEQLPNELWITGESYGGRYVPAIAYKLFQERATSKMNLKGLAIGNGFIDGATQSNYADLLYEIGMFDEHEHHQGHKYEKKIEKYGKEKEYKKCYKVISQYVLGDNNVTSLFFNATGSKNFYDFTKINSKDDSSSTYLARQDVRTAINVGNRTMSDGSKVSEHLLEDICKNVKPWLEELLNEKYQVLLYNGQLDIIVAPALTERLIQHLHWEGAHEYKKSVKKIWRLQDEPDDVAGYIRSHGNFHYVVVRNAGHMVPTYQPKASYELLKKFTAGELDG